MKKFLFFLVSLSIFNSNAQKFIPGYVIDNQGVKTECLIDKAAAYYSPDTFSYKISDSNDAITASVQNIKEFGINGIATFYRFEVDIDETNDIISDLDSDRKLNMKSKTLFLEILAKGKINLYLYSKEKIKRFFYSNQTNSIPQMLDYKKYIKQEEISTVISENEDYKRELYNLVKDGSISYSEIINLRYEEKEIMSIINKYNQFFNSSDILTNNDKSSFKKVRFLFKPALGLISQKANYKYDKNTELYKPVDFKNKLNISFGLEFEILMPINISLYASSTYIRYNQQAIQQIGYSPNINEYESSIDYKSIKTIFGARKYVYLNKDSDLFFGIGYIFDFVTNKDQKQKIIPSNIQITNTNGFSFGLGYSWKKTFSVALNYDLKRNLNPDYVYSELNYNEFSVLLTYDVLKILNKKHKK